ncbi:MAG: VCBS repeat-containing protein, partial [Paraglaciecola sp.]|nr:VCBS repeat-containing protein [Paraglaciecola sp.]
MLKIKLPKCYTWLKCFVSLVFCAHASMSLATNFTEDFSTLTLKDASETTANWSTASKNVSLPWVTKQAGGMVEFRDAVGISSSRATQSLITVDIDGDGDMDVLEGNYNQANRVYLNNGDGTFADGTDISSVTDDIEYTNSLTTADIDGDGDLDVLAGNGDGFFGNANRVYLNNGDGTFATGAEISIDTNRTYSLITADIDGDGDMDVLAGNGDGFFGNANRVYLNNGDGTFATGTEISIDTNRTYSLITADID